MICNRCWDNAFAQTCDSQYDRYLENLSNCEHLRPESNVVQYASDEKFQLALGQVFSENSELLSRLARGPETLTDTEREAVERGMAENDRGESVSTEELRQYFGDFESGLLINEHEEE